MFTVDVWDGLDHDLAGGRTKTPPINDRRLGSESRFLSELQTLYDDNQHIA